MSASDFDLPPALEALLQQVCSEQGLASRRHDEIRQLVQSTVESWAVCCGGSCEPCVEASKATARLVLARWAELTRS